MRTSWIVDPPDGRLPFTAEAVKRFQFDNPKFAAGFDNPEDQTVTTRCVASENGAAPSLNGPDGNFLRIVQVPGYVLLLAEKYNDLRIDDLAGRHPSACPSTGNHALLAGRRSRAL